MAGVLKTIKTLNDYIAYSLGTFQQDLPLTIRLHLAILGSSDISVGGSQFSDPFSK
jgi:hypothetical protein